jgi:tetratricopeptide (TPR) repeat protein
MNRDETTKVVPFDRSRRYPDPARVAAFGATARRLMQEKADSSDAVLRVLRETPREEWSSNEALHNTGALQQLSREVEAHLDSEPHTSLAIAEIATRTAELLPDTAYPGVVLAQARGIAWKDRGQALCYLARYEEALRALDRAEVYLQDFGALAHDVGIVRFVRATVLQHLRRFDEAQELLDSARTIFNDHGDVNLYRKCTAAAGNLLVRRGDYRAARETFHELLRDGDADPVSTAIAHAALGWCAIHLGSAGEALHHFEDAEHRCRQLSRDLDTVRVTYGAGAALLRLGDVDRALERLHFARARFLEHALIEEAGLSGLEIVEAQMLRNEFESAKKLASAIVREFTEASLNRRAVAALAYLNDAIAASSATPAVVRNVGAYIISLRTYPDREFAAAN